MTSDATNSLQTSYNLLNLPAQIKSGSTVKANYTYLSDGTKAGGINTSGAGYYYLGSFTYSRSKVLESVRFNGGTIRKSGSSYLVDYHVTDHLGSVRAIVTNGSIIEQNDYYPFGTRHSNGLTTFSPNRWRFSGKEEQDGAFGIAYSDFGARFYDRTAWTSIDPMAEKYYSVSPYAYCNNNPVNRIDPNGMTDWKTVRQGAYSVVGGVASTIGGAVMAGASAGTLAGLSAFLISDGIVAIGTGATLMTIGFVDDSQLSEEAQNIPMSIPEMGGVSIDSLTDNEDHFWKSIGTGVDYVIGAGASAITGFSPAIPSLLGLTAPVASMVDNVISEKSKENSSSSEVEPTNLSFDSNTNYLWDPNHLYLSF